MVLYRCVIRPLGPLASPLHSDTLFGAFCWGWRSLSGSGSLEEEIISPSLAGAPPIIFSNGFPHHTLPLPLGCHDTAVRSERQENKRDRQAAWRKNKTIQDTRYVDREAFLRIRNGDWSGFCGDLCKDAGSAATTLHNTVSRESGTAEDPDGAGGLFGSDRRFFSPDQEFDFYLLTSLPGERLERTLELMLETGIGADKSTGCGGFSLLSLDEETELAAPPEGANGFVAISNFLPAASDPTEGWYQVFTKYPRLDREFASSGSPYKKPMLMVKAGSMFHTGSLRPWYGRCITGIAAVPAPVTVNGCTIAVPVRIPAEAVNRRQSAS